MKPLPDTSMGGYVAPPREVQAVVQVGFFSIWLTRDTKEYNGVEGKMFYVHHHSLWIAEWLFDDPLMYRKWKSVENFERDAVKRFNIKVREYARAHQLMSDLNKLLK